MQRKVITTLHYFAYGSNLHPIRLQERVPSAKVLGVVKATGRQLTFSKRGKDLSGKCNFYETGNQQDIVYGVLYEFDVNEKSNLDKAEGKGYNEKIISLTLNEISYSPFTYIADSKHIDGSLMPFEWYKQFVIVGAQFHAMPQEYIAWLTSITAIPDPDPNRNTANLDRLNTMKEYNKLMKPPAD